MRVDELRERLAQFPDYWDVPGVVDVRAETRVTTHRDAATGAPVRDGAVVVVIA